MANSTILNMPLVASNQNQKETTINTALAILEASYNDVASYSMSSGNRTLTTDQFTKFFHMVFDGQTAPRTVTIPARKRFFSFSNEGSFNLTIHCSGSSGTDLIVGPGLRVLVMSDGTDVLAVSQGVQFLSDLSDVVGAGAASGGQRLGFDANTSTWIPMDSSGDQSFFCEGAPTASKKVLRYVFARDARLFSDFSGSQSDADVAATAEAVFNVYKNDTLVGTITFAAAATTATYSTDTGSGSSSVTFAPGDVLTVIAPASPDATLADISVTLKGVLL